MEISIDFFLVNLRLFFSLYSFNFLNFFCTDAVDISNVRQRKFLCNEQRKLIYNALLERSVNGKLKKKTTREVSTLFDVNIRCVQRIWKRSQQNTDGVVNVSHMKTKNCGRKRVQIDLTRVQEIPLHRRTTLRSLSAALNVGYHTLFNHFKDGLIRRHSNAIKPFLKDENQLARLRFCLSMLDPRSMPYEPKFVDMYNVIHIDEKWFYMTKKKENYYLLPEEGDPLRTCQSKNFIGKVMFLAAMARPRFDAEGNEVFSGKIGIFPFVTEKPAERRSRNRDAGTMVMKPMTSIKRETIRAFFIEKVIPAIKRNWPREDAVRTIYIQQDNARTHIDPSDEQFQIVASQDGFDIRLTCQPSNSPDLNILDLGFFSSIQALQHKECPRTVPELLLAVEKSFNEYPSQKLNRVFVTLQLCMREIMKHGGSNKYKIPHVNKDRLEREGRLPTQVSCDYDLVQSVMNLVA